LAHDYTVLVIADHGNCEKWWILMKSKYGAYYKTLVLYLVDKDLKEVHDGVLGDMVWLF
jgi:2,3-bisphosphoglycerate-independent phosphoglycerate mutase